VNETGILRAGSGRSARGGPKHTRKNAAAPERRLLLVTAVSGAGMLIAVVVSLINDRLFHLSYPSNTFVFVAHDRFADGMNTISYVRSGDPYASVNMVYFPFTNAVVWPFTWGSDHAGVVALTAVLVTVTAVLVMWGTSHLTTLPRRLIATVVLLASYPIVFTIDRSNVEVLVFVFVAAFGVAMAKRRPGLAAAAISGAIAMKLTPLVFAGVFLRKGQRKWLGLTAVLVAVETFVGLVMLRPPVITSIRELKNDLAYYNRLYVVDDSGYHFGHSLLGGVKGIATQIAGESGRDWVGHTFGSSATALSIVALAAVALLIGFTRRPLWWKVTVATASLLLFTPVSADYRLIHLFVPLALFVGAQDRIPRDRLIAVVFGLLLVPKTFDWSFGNFSWELGITVSNIASATLLAALLVLTLLARPEPPLAQHPPEGSQPLRLPDPDPVG
jgi:hypothetical protein